MKYLKQYEELNDRQPKIGDKIICISNNNTDDILEKYAIYTIKNIMKYEDFNDQYELRNVIRWWDASRFKLATPQNIKEYEIKKDTDKYNL